VLSVIVPVYNEQEVLETFHARLAGVLDSIGMEREVLYVDDGSTDGSAAIVRRLRGSDRSVALLALSRNFGKEAAVTAGLERARGAAVVIMDADLQDPPELIKDFVGYWKEGFDVVYGRRGERDDSFLQRATATLFYRVARRMSRVRLPRDTGDFQLLSRRAVDALLQLPERHRYLKGLFAWIGFEQREVRYDRPAREAGRTKYSYRTRWRVALTAITSFSTLPVRLATYLGLSIVLGALVYGFAGESTLMFVVLLLGGTQLVTLGVLGEYVARMFDETKRRPLYIVKEYEPCGTAGDEGLRPIQDKPGEDRYGI